MRRLRTASSWRDDGTRRHGPALSAAIDDRGYREAQIDAGIACGRLQLAATALGFGATGMTFVDTELPAVIGAPLAGLLLTCLGVAPFRTTRAGTPRNPRDVSER